MIAPAGPRAGAERQVLVDANVLIDVFSTDAAWHAWSRAALTDVLDRGGAVVNSIVYAEVAAGFADQASLDAVLHRDVYRREDPPWGAAYLAGRAFAEYRRRGGERGAPLPDFYIGAHAAVRGYALLTRDAARFRTYFPAVPLITP